MRKFSPHQLRSALLPIARGGYMGPASAYQRNNQEVKNLTVPLWAAGAIDTLCEKYDVIDEQDLSIYKSGRVHSAKILGELIKAVGRDLARLGAEKADKDDLAMLAKLQDEFKEELAQLYR